MKLVGMMLAHNEAWCIGLGVRVALDWCDELIVLDHNSTDSTLAILHQLSLELPGRIHIVYVRDKPFNEALMRQQLLEAARGRGMTHGAVIDADELLTAGMVKRARGFVENARPGEMPHIPMLSPHGSLGQYRIDPAFNDKWISVWFKDAPELHYSIQNDGYHYHARVPIGLKNTYMHLEKFGAQGGCWHLQTISRRRLEVKAAFYKALERVHFPDKHTVAQLRDMYDWAINAIPEIRATPRDWIEDHEALATRWLDLSADPWQLAELRRLISTSPHALFDDLDVYAAAYGTSRSTIGAS